MSRAETTAVRAVSTAVRAISTTTTVGARAEETGIILVVLADADAGDVLDAAVQGDARGDGGRLGAAEGLAPVVQEDEDVVDAEVAAELLAQHGQVHGAEHRGGRGLVGFAELVDVARHVRRGGLLLAADDVLRRLDRVVGLDGQVRQAHAGLGDLLLG